MKIKSFTFANNTQNWQINEIRFDNLKEYLEEFGLRYIQSSATIITEKEYLEALIERCKSTNHLSSLKYLLDILDKM